MTTPPPFSFDLSGRTVLVTGASSGIGRHIARLLARSGANVAIGARRVALLAELEAELRDLGGRVLALPLDVSDETSVINAFDTIEATFGPANSVIANAGINMGKSALSISATDFDALMAVNVRGVFLTAREGARRMIANGSAERGDGRILLISSITGEHPPAGLVAYAASKAAVNQMARTMAKDWARKGINVNAIAPGYIQTEMTDELWESDHGKKLLASFPRQRLMDPDALDVLTLYLCSQASAQITGSVFTIDDGQTL